MENTYEIGRHHGRYYLAIQAHSILPLISPSRFEYCALRLWPAAQTSANIFRRPPRLGGESWKPIRLFGQCLEAVAERDRSDRSWSSFASRYSKFEKIHCIVSLQISVVLWGSETDVRISVL